MRVFSSVVALGRMLVIWYERAMPFCEIRSGDSPVMSPPLNKICPDEGRNTPVRQLKKVLLPAPFGPIIARISPRSTAKLLRFSAVSPPKRTVRSSVRNSGADAPGKDSSETYSNAADIVLIQFHDGDNRLWTIISPPICASVVMFSGRGVMAGWRAQRLVPRDGLLDMIGAILDDIDQLAHEHLMIVLPQHLVAGRKVGTRLHREAFERLDQLGRIGTALKARLLDAELQRVDRLEVRLNIPVGQRS